MSNISAARWSTTDRPEKPVRFERVERPERIERPSKREGPERLGNH
jgi:hypothetical protein